MIDFKQIDEARKLLGLYEEATLAEIKQAYRKLSLKYHPDKCKDEDKPRCEEMFKRITQARDILLSYCANYKFSFREADVKRNLPPDDVYAHIKRFYSDWF